MELQPPWASELLARNRKVARNICWSTSLDSSSGIINDNSERGLHVIFARNNSYDDRSNSPHHNPTSNTASSRRIEKGRPIKGTMVKRGMTTNHMKMARDEGKVVDPLGVLSSATAYTRTEKAAPNLEQVAAEEAEPGGDMKNKSEEESILEYGPGIVRKLRSRYQSLALRQSLTRPSLRRSASLENCLDSVSSEPLSSESPSPIPYYEDEVDAGNDHNRHLNHGSSRRIISAWNSNQNSSNTVLIFNNVVNNVNANNIIGNNRGRSGYADRTDSRRDRMRRARSVDALHRPSKRQIEEKEILEKLTVVLPKEEIVIIEVSKPHSILSNGTVTNYNHIGIDDKQHSHPRSLHINGYNKSGNSSEINRARSVTSPEHELPPPDIVRETARIFEKNQDHQQQQQNNSSTSPTNNLLIGSVKKVGHALRLSKSSSLSPSSSPLPSPTMASQHHNMTTLMNGETHLSNTEPHQYNQSSQNKGHLNTDQGLNTSTASLLNHKLHKTQDVNHRNFSTSNGVAFNSKSTIPNSTTTPNSSFTGNNHTAKQIGVIRPTVNTPGSGVTSSTKGIKVSSDKVNNNRNNNSIPSPDLSPIPNIPSSKKPPLGPKPLVASSPKNIFLQSSTNNNKTGSTTLTETPANGTNAKSPTTEEPVSLERESKMKSPTTMGPSSAPRVVSSSNKATNMTSSKSMDIPLEKENEAMEFQQITLKHVEKPKEHSEFILTNGPTTNPTNSFSSKSHVIPKTNIDTKTEKKDNAVITNNKNAPVKGRVSPGGQPISNANISNSTTAFNSNTSSKDIPKPQVQQHKDIIPKIVQSQKEIPKPQQFNTAKEAPKPKPKKDPEQQQSSLRTHQKQISDKHKNSGVGETMVFNFTSRKNVPDYIEDDGLHKVKMTLNGTVMDESQDDDAELNGYETVDSRLITFEGANVIINGRSSIQKKPKSQKLNISFNGEAPLTFEYPSEASILGDDDSVNTKDTLLGHKTPNITNGSGLGSYTPSKLGNSYQLGNYTDRVVVTKKPLEKKEDSSEFIEDYLRPDTGSTTWSSETGAADILF